MPHPNRIHSIDLLRGLVMIVMALDHTRDLFHAGAFTDDPLNLETASPSLFLTRWITHFCAPVFVFLSGTSIYLQSQRKTKKELSGFLIKRGLWLLIAEFTIITLAITFDLRFPAIIFQVIGAIGISMIILGLLIWMPFAAILLLGLLIVFGHNVMDAWEKVRGNNFPLWYYPLHRPGFIPVTDHLTLMLFYPFVPWTGIMLLGYCFGKVYSIDVVNRQRKIIFTGLGAVLLFVIIRGINSYGDPNPWSPQRNFLYTAFSFIRTQKYPPSLDYTLMTLGPALVLLGLAEKIRGKLSNFITVYGQVPFFYYILHFYLIHSVSAILFLVRGHTVSEGINAFPQIPLKFIVPGEGYSLGLVYLIWILIVLALYLPCRWYARYKKAHGHWWLSYL